MKGAGSIKYLGHLPAELEKLGTRHLMALLDDTRRRTFACECCGELITEADRDMAFKVRFLRARIKRILAARPHLERETRHRHVVKRAEKKRMRF